MSRRREQVNGQDAGTVHFEGADAQAHDTLCGHSMNVESGHGWIRFEETTKPVNCKTCLRAAREVLMILGFSKRRAGVTVERAAT